MNSICKKMVSEILMLTAVLSCVTACAEGVPDQGMTVTQTVSAPASSGKTQQQVIDEYVQAKKCGTLSVGDINYPENENALHPGWYRNADCASKK